MATPANTDSRGYEQHHAQPIKHDSMTAAELIKELQQVAPNTPVTIATDNGTKGIDRVAYMGYHDGRFVILPVED